MTIPTHGGRAVEAEPDGEARATAPPPHHQSWRARRRAACPRPVPRGSPAGPAGRGRRRAARGAGPRGLGLRHGAGLGRRSAARAQRLRRGVADRRVHPARRATSPPPHPDVTVTFNFAGSNDLVTQVQQGAPADVLATADTSSMDKAGDLTGAAAGVRGQQARHRRRARQPRAHHRARRPGARGPQGRAGGAGGARRQVRRGGPRQGRRDRGARLARGLRQGRRHQGLARRGRRRHRLRHRRRRGEGQARRESRSPTTRT